MNLGGDSDDSELVLVFGGGALLPLWWWSFLCGDGVGGVRLWCLRLEGYRCVWCSTVMVFGGGAKTGFWSGEGVLALVSCPVTPEKARTLGVAEGCSSLLRLAGLWYLVEFFCIRC
ncbi:hypothetical protein QL285_065188 [Trifolium repens]|nr:hypothetical protein QL285_065188 [Trifolium repens]